MPHNLLVTGPPRSGKTTVVERVVDRLADRGYRVGGVVSPERREGGERVGFDLEDVMTGERRTLAHVDRREGPSVGKYRVNPKGAAAISETALPRALAEADVVVVDEIAPMEVASDAFVTHVGRALDAAQPVLAAIHDRSTSGFIGTVKDRDDAELIQVTPATRDDLPAELSDRLGQWLAS